ncbi:MAG: hypothetical protein Kow0013_08810 [Pararhodobacter sp.]
MVGVPVPVPGLAVAVHLRGGTDGHQGKKHGGQKQGFAHGSLSGWGWEWAYHFSETPMAKGAKRFAPSQRFVRLRIVQGRPRRNRAPRARRERDQAVPRAKGWCHARIAQVLADLPWT